MAVNYTGDTELDPDIIAGGTSTGTLTVENEVVSVDSLFQAGVPKDVANAPTYGLITLTGSGTDVTIEDPAASLFYASVEVGRNNPGSDSGGAGYGGYLEILNGASLTSLSSGYFDATAGFARGGYGHLQLGRGADSFGRMTVDGGGSSFVAAGIAPAIQVGRDGGKGELVISGGGEVQTLQGNFGRDGGTGGVAIEGAGSRLVSSDANGGWGAPAYDGEAGLLDFGRGGGSGYFHVRSGGELRVENIDGQSDMPILRLGRDNGGYGYGVVEGAGSAINVVQRGPAGDDYQGGARLFVGQGGEGELVVRNGGAVNVTGDYAGLAVAYGRAAAGVPDNTAAESLLRVESGGVVTVDSGTYGYDGGAQAGAGIGVGTNGRISVDGAGSRFELRSPDNTSGDYDGGGLFIGATGTGALEISNGGAVAARHMAVGESGYALDAGGAVIEETEGYSGTVTGGGYGRATVSSGGSLTLTDTDDYAAPGLRIGQASGSDGAVTVQGAGSSLTVQGTPGAIGGTISLGRYGTGALEVLAGAEANAFWVDSSREGGDSLLRVDGAGSVLRLSDAYGGFGPGYGGYGGFLRVARNDTATGALEVTGGGRVEIGNSGTGYSGAGLQMARNGGSYAQGLISGAGSAVEVVQTGAPDAGWRGGPFAQIGSGGRAEMEVADGGLLALRGAAAVLTVGGERDGLTDPTGSALQVLSGGRVVVDSEGYGGLFTLDLGVDAYGAPITADVPVGAQAVVGGGYDVRGGLQVDGAGSSFTVRSDDRSQSDYQTGQLLVGVGGGYGDLHVSNGGAVDVRALGLGGGGYGVARVESGGAITVTGSDATAYQGLRIGQGGGGEGDLTIDGAGSTVTVTGIPDANGAPESAARWTVGREGYGTVSVTNGGTANGFSADIGRGTGGDGSVSVDGYGSSFNLSNAFGRFNPALYGPQGGSMNIGRGDGATGRLDVTGGGAVNVTNAPGTVADIPVFTVGRDGGGLGIVTVSGDDGAGNASRVNVQLYGASNDGYTPGDYLGPLVRLGRDGGEGRLYVSDGGRFDLIGEDAQLRVGGGLDSGDPLAAPTSLLDISSGGVVTVDSRERAPGVQAEAAAGVTVGFRASGNGAVSVSGAGSELRILSDNASDYDAGGALKLGAGLTIGAYGAGSLDVLNGGTVTLDAGGGVYPGLAIGRFDGSSGEALVSGAGSRIEVSGTSAGAGPNFVSGAGGSIDVASRAGSTGRLVIEAGGEVVNSPTNARSQIASETGSDGELVVTGAGSRFEAGGKLAVAADYDLATNAFVTGASGDGRLEIRDGGVVVAGETMVGDTGALAISGGILESAVELRGAFDPGGAEEIGDARVAGDLVQTAGIAEFEIGGFAPGAFDTLLVEGDATFDAAGMRFDLSGLGPVAVGDTAAVLSVTGALTLDPALIPAAVAAPAGVTVDAFRSTDIIDIDGTQTAVSQLSVVVTGAPGGAVGVNGFEVRADEGDSGSGGALVFTLSRSGDLTRTLDVDFAVSGRGANPADAADFAGGVLPSGTASFAAGDSETTVTLDLAGDTNVEPDEGLTLALSNPVSSGPDPVAISNADAPGLIRNDDAPAAISISFEREALEADPGGSSLIEFEVTRTGDLSQPVTVDYLVDANGDGANDDTLADPADFAAGVPQTGSVTFAAGQDTAIIGVEIAGDDVIEPRESFTVSLSGVQGSGSYIFGNQTATGEIVNDDGRPPVIPQGLAADLFGDPHVVTLDGLGYDFQAVGEFTLIRSTSGPDINVQVRTAPVEGSDLVSVITAMAADVDGARVMIDSTGEPQLRVDGVATEVPATGADPVAIGGAGAEIFFDGEVYTLVQSSGEAVRAAVFDGFMNVNVFLDPAVRAPASVEGLLGNGNGDVGDDFTLGDGSPVPADKISVDGSGTPSLDFDFLYGDYADSWRVTDATSLFDYSGAAGDTGTDDYTDRSFPAGVLTVDTLPAALLAEAEAAADAAGITDPELRKAAILDFALTGDEQFAAGASGVAGDATVETEPAESPALPTTVGVTAATSRVTEGDAGSQTATFTFYRIGDSTVPLEVSWRLAGDADAGDLAGAPALSGTTAFATGQDTVSISFDIAGDGVFEADERLRVLLDGAPDGVLVGASSAITVIANDDNAPVGLDDAVSGDDGGPLDIAAADLLSNDADPDGDALRVDSVSAVSAAGAAVSLSGGVVTYDPTGVVDVPARGQVADSFTYLLSDDAGGTDTVTVAVTLSDSDTLIGSDAVDDVLDGGPGNDVIEGRGGADTLDGGADDDEIRPGAGTDEITLGAGADTVAGPAGELFDDTVTDFTTEDRLLFEGAGFGRGDMTVSSGPARLGIDLDGDGSEDGHLTLTGDFTTGDFMAVTTGSDTQVTFEDFLPALSAGARVDPALVNGVINQAFLNGDMSDRFEVTLLPNIGFAAFDNVLGAYEIASDGSVLEARILSFDAKAQAGTTISVDGIAAGNNLGFFLVQDAADAFAAFSDADSFAFVDAAGAPASVEDGAGVRLQVNGTDVAQPVFHSFSQTLNADGVQHALSGVESGGESIVMGFEDLVGGGDSDYEDLVFRIEAVEDAII